MKSRMEPLLEQSLKSIPSKNCRQTEEEELDSSKEDLTGARALAYGSELAALGRYEQARGLLESIPSGSPYHVVALDFLARIRAQQGRFLEAEELWRIAAQLDPGNEAYAEGLRRIARIHRSAFWNTPVIVSLVAMVSILLLVYLLPTHSEEYKAPIVLQESAAALSNEVEDLRDTVVTTLNEGKEEVRALVSLLGQLSQESATASSVFSSNLHEASYVLSCIVTDLKSSLGGLHQGFLDAQAIHKEDVSEVSSTLLAEWEGVQNLMTQLEKVSQHSPVDHDLMELQAVIATLTEELRSLSEGLTESLRNEKEHRDAFRSLQIGFEKLLDDLNRLVNGSLNQNLQGSIPPSD